MAKSISGLLSVVFVFGSLVSLSTACNNDTIWELITCGHQVHMYLDESTDLCSMAEYNRDKINIYFRECLKGFEYDSCTDEQKEGFVLDRFIAALDAIPCDVSVTPGCVQNTMTCVTNVAKKVGLDCTRGTYCFCNYREAHLAELEKCNTILNDASCATANETEKNKLAAGIDKLKTALADRNCASVDKTQCVCAEILEECVEVNANFTHLLNHAYNLVEVSALQDKSLEQNEENRAWRQYQKCRTEGYPDQYDRAVKCFNSFPSQCNVKFPHTLAYAEYNSNTTFYQTSAAVVKNLQQFCHVWCRNTTHWTGLMVNCLEHFHPSDVEIMRENIIKYILSAGRPELRRICQELKADPSNPLEKQLTCAGDAMGQCYYLPYHIILADLTAEIRHTLTASDALEALHEVLIACDYDTIAWANNVIEKGMNGSTGATTGLGGNLDFDSFFNGGNAIDMRLGVVLLYSVLVLFATLIYFK